MTVHWLENVDGDPLHIRTVCRMVDWHMEYGMELDPDRCAKEPVTCPECLTAMADVPIVVEVK